MKITAIETRYAGCRFRSRLEARWAVFLDHLSIFWGYESEGFETPAGRYLPDFWLPGHRIWLEVKGDLSSFSASDLARCAHVAARAHTQGNKFAILVGDIPRTPVFDDKHGPLGIRCLMWGVLADGSQDFIGFDGEHGHAYWLPALKGLPQALTAARSARFEHGQNGAQL